jgi:prepilin-type processing-associated H-X9-DG protein
MKKLAGLTRIDLVVTVLCLLFVLINVPVILAGGRQNAKLHVCMANLSVLTDAWNMFADDNAGKIPSGDVYYSWSFSGPSGSPTGPQGGWFEWPHYWNTSTNPADGSKMPPHSYTNTIANPKTADWQHAIACGLLWNYVKNYNTYKCPVGQTGSFVTYSMSMSMNTWPNAGNGGSLSASEFQPFEIRNRNQITQPEKRFIFLDVGGAASGAFFIQYRTSSTIRWGSFPPMRHGKGTTFSFADGHAEYRIWTEPTTLNCTFPQYGWNQCPGDDCDCDLRWMTKITWGKVGRPCTLPGKQCED